MCIFSFICSSISVTNNNTFLYKFRYGECDKNLNEFTFAKTFVMASGAFTQRGFGHVPSTWKARIAFMR